MLICGNYYSGEKRSYILTYNKVKDAELINEIKNAMSSLTNLQNDFVLVDLFIDFKDIYGIPVFFKAYKDRSFGRTDYYIVESGIQTKDGIAVYYRHDVSKEMATELFESICLDRKQLDDQWRHIDKYHYDNGNIVDRKSDDGKRASVIANRYWSGEMIGKSAEFAHAEAVEFLSGIESDVSYGEALVEIYIKHGEYIKIKNIFDKLSHNQLVALAMGEAEYFGKLGKPNYKKAYEYFLHSAKLGSTEANYFIGQMYKYGLYVKKDMQKYMDLTYGVYDFYVENDAEYAMLCIDYVILELAKIERQRRNFDKSIEFCLQARENAVLNCFYGGNVSNTLCEVIKLLYELTEFDGSDMDLFDLLYLFEKPCKVRIKFRDEQIIAQSIAFNGGMMIECGGNYFRNTKEFLNKYTIQGKSIVKLYEDVEDIEVIR